jgi:hypothetical protein
VEFAANLLHVAAMNPATVDVEAPMNAVQFFKPMIPPLALPASVFAALLLVWVVIRSAFVIPAPQPQQASDRAEHCRDKASHWAWDSFSEILSIFTKVSFMMFVSVFP